MSPALSGRRLLLMLAVVVFGFMLFLADGMLRRADSDAAGNELRFIQSAVTTMMTHNGLTEIPNPVTEATRDMEAFPDATTSPLLKGLFAEDKPGYVLYRHDTMADGAPEGTVDYLRFATTRWYYTVERDGTVVQWETPVSTAE